MPDTQRDEQTSSRSAAADDSAGQASTPPGNTGRPLANPRRIRRT